MPEKSTSVVVVANQKGGVGKTTTVVNLAAAFAEMDKRVLVIDFDFQGNATDALGVRQQATKTSQSIVRAIRLEQTLEAVRLESNTAGVDVIAATRDLIKVEADFRGRPRQHRLIELILATDALYEYDVVLIDTHPSLDILLMSALTAAHYYLIPVFAESDSMSGLHFMLTETETIRRDLNPSLIFLGCVVTNFDQKTATHRRFEAALREVAKTSNFPILSTLIPASKSVKAASGATRPVIGYAPADSPVCRAYRDLAQELLPSLQGQRRGRVASPNLVAMEQMVDEIEAGVELD